MELFLELYNISLVLSLIYQVAQTTPHHGYILPVFFRAYFLHLLKSQNQLEIFLKLVSLFFSLCRFKFKPQY